MSRGIECLSASGEGLNGGRTVAFVLPLLLPTSNALLRMHHRERTKLRTQLAWQVFASTTGHIPPEPFARARVTVDRLGLMRPDLDNLYGSAKHLLDVLQPHSDRHPSGLGLIAGDDPERCDLVCSFVRINSPAQQRTRVLVEELLGVSEERAWGYYDADGVFRELPKAPMVQADLGPPPFTVQVWCGPRRVVEAPDEPATAVADE